MDLKKISPLLSVSPQITPQDIGIASAQGFKAIINNRPDNEANDQPTAAELKAAAERHGMEYRDIPVIPGKITDEEVSAFKDALASMDGPILAFCRTGNRSTTLWALSEAGHIATDSIVQTAENAGYDLSALRPRLDDAVGAAASGGAVATGSSTRSHDVVIVGGGTAGIATASSLLRRRADLDIVIVEPQENHFYQPGWTLVGGGIFTQQQTTRPTGRVMPKQVTWIRSAVAEFDPKANQVVLEDGERIGYRILVAAPGLKLDWERIEGLEDTLGKGGVTSNYRFDLAPYTWQLVQGLKSGTALFSQPPMPIKCAGAPQKAMYLSADHWLRQGTLKDIDVEFNCAAPGLFGVADYVPALMEYVGKYDIELCFQENLVAVDGAAKKAWFERTKEDGSTERVEKSFDMLHVTPPQCAPDFVRNSPLANADGWIDVDSETLQHVSYGNIFALGDATNTPNAKTAAAVRAQVPAVCENIVAALDGHEATATYNGYGSCPLTVERGKIVLAEFGYGGKLLPTFPTWLMEGRKATWMAWVLKTRILPPMYWYVMLKGREWMVKAGVKPRHQN